MDSSGTDSGYRPISCANHDVFEIAILHRTPLRLTWMEDDILHEQTLMPVDLETRDHQEFLIGRASDGKTLRLRLDWIRESRPA